MARPRKARHLRVIAGTERRDRPADEPAAAGKPLTEAPPAPDWLPNAHATREWQRLAPICIRIGTLSEGTLTMFGHLCSIHGKLVQLSVAGSMPSASLVAQLRALAADFGLNSRVIRAPTDPGPGEKATPSNPFDRFD